MFTGYQSLSTLTTNGNDYADADLNIDYYMSCLYNQPFLRKSQQSQTQIYLSEEDVIGIESIRKYMNKRRLMEIKRNIHFADRTNISN